MTTEKTTILGVELYSEWNRTLIVADEIGDLGKEPKKIGKIYAPSKVLGFGISVVFDPDKYADIALSYKKEKDIRGEMKARKMDNIEKIEVAAEIRKSGAETSGHYIDKTKDTPIGWKEQKGADSLVGLLLNALESTISKVDSKKIVVVVDRHNAYYGKNGESLAEAMSEELSRRCGKEVFCVIGRGSKSDWYSDHIQTNDVVSNAILERKERHNPLVALVMRQKQRRLGKNDDIRRK